MSRLRIGTTKGAVYEVDLEARTVTRNNEPMTLFEGLVNIISLNQAREAKNLKKGEHDKIFNYMEFPPCTSLNNSPNEDAFKLVYKREGCPTGYSSKITSIEEIN
ncbi:MAG: hypothetical protein ABIB47_05730 [Candidatus Woesearchaeota archaeon]